MPWTRRCTNAISTALLTLVTGHRMLDSQCGMRLYRVEALEHAPLPPGRYEAETRHLRTALRAGLAVGWVPIPAIYNGERSSFRPVPTPGACSARSSARTGAAIGRRPRRPPRSPAAGRCGSRCSSPRRWGSALAMPLLQPLDERLFLEVNALGAGPEWLHDALDPHTRNYILLCLAATLAAAFYGRRAAIGRGPRDDDRRALVGRARPARLHAVRARPAGGGARRRRSSSTAATGRTSPRSRAGTWS